MTPSSSEPKRRGIPSHKFKDMARGRSSVELLRAPNHLRESSLDMQANSMVQKGAGTQRYQWRERAVTVTESTQAEY